MKWSGNSAIFLEKSGKKIAGQKWEPWKDSGCKLQTEPEPNHLKRVEKCTKNGLKVACDPSISRTTQLGSPRRALSRLRAPGTEGDHR